MADQNSATKASKVTFRVAEQNGPFELAVLMAPVFGKPVLSREARDREKYARWLPEYRSYIPGFY